MKFASYPLQLLALLPYILPARAEISATNEVFPGIFIHSETRTNPPTRLFVAEIDLTNPRIHLHVAPGGPDPDGDGKWQTSLMPPTKIAAREKFDLVINGDFFAALLVKDAEGTNSGYRAGQWAAVVGPAVTDGKIWSTVTNARPCLVVHTNRSVTIEDVSRPSGEDWEVISGNTMLLKAGSIVSHEAKVRHPRTVVGLDASGKKLIILLVDGRKPGIAIGMSHAELAAEMLRLGCRDALNLDGGGSSVLAVRDVANVLGISVDQP